MADTQTVHPHPAGVLTPVRSEDDFELEVVGRIPDALAGAYYRNGPNPQFDPEGPYFPFLGDGMIHAFFLEPNKNGGRAYGGRARYRNRYLRTPKWHAENKAGRLLWGGWGEAIDPSVADLDPLPANIHIVHHAGKLLALFEHSEPFELDPQGLERGAFMNTGGKRTAHPKIDPETGEMVWFAYWAGPEPFSNLIDYGVTDKTGKVTRRDRFAAPYASMIHDFLVTRNYVLFPVMPLTGDRQRATKGLPPMTWEATKGGFIGVMKRSDRVDSIRWFEIEPQFFLHSMNAWEDGERVHCEVTEFPHPPSFPSADGSPAQDVEGRLTRWTIDLVGNTNRAKRERIDDLNAEMPRLDDRFAGLPYRHGWYMANIDSKYPLMHDAIAHIDFKTGKRAVRMLGPGDAASEPVVVPRCASAPEGDGYIIALVYRAASDTSELLILDAPTIAGEPAAVLKLPRRVPAGTHGNFVPA
ncbi:MAG TPA: carotenoid oxygenase family protein [Phycisphaerae bacterium]